MTTVLVFSELRKPTPSFLRNSAVEQIEPRGGSA